MQTEEVLVATIACPKCARQIDPASPRCPECGVPRTELGRKLSHIRAGTCITLWVLALAIYGTIDVLLGLCGGVIVVSADTFKLFGGKTAFRARTPAGAVKEGVSAVIAGAFLACYFSSRPPRQQTPHPPDLGYFHQAHRPPRQKTPHASDLAPFLFKKNDAPFLLKKHDVNTRWLATSAYWQAAVMEPEATSRTAEAALAHKPVTVAEYLDHLRAEFEKERRRIEQLPTDRVDSDLVAMVRQHLVTDARMLRTFADLLPWLRAQKIADLPFFDPRLATEEAWAHLDKLMALPPGQNPLVDALQQADRLGSQQDDEIIAMRKKLQLRYGNALPLPAYLIEEK